MSQPTAKLPAFKAYDIRGRQPEELNPAFAYHLGAALADLHRPASGQLRVVLGMDSRLTSPTLLQAVAAGAAGQGAAVFSLGLCGTEEVYHAAGTNHADVGIMITASHNPIEYNGMKLVKAGGLPFEPATDLAALEATTRARLQTDPEPTIPTFTPEPLNLREAYVDHLFTLVNPADIPAQTLVVDAGHGAAGPTVDAILARLPQLTVIRLHHTPDGTFPAGIPNPLLPKNREKTSAAVCAHGASLGIAWDGDFDRCFLYDRHGQFISNYDLATLLATAMLRQYPGATLGVDPRLNWATRAAITAHGGQASITRVGHGFIKPQMRAEDLPFTGEISGHFYFREFFTCDSGMLTWLLALAELGRSGQTLEDWVATRQRTITASDEQNFNTPSPAKAFLAMLEPHLPSGTVTRVDGLSVEASNQWRFNLRASSNEPLLRLNLEATSPAAYQQLEAQLHTLLAAHGATPAADH